MASDTDIANRALQLLGEKRITSLTQDYPTARDINASYTLIRDAELRRHPWGFATTRATLAASATAPAFEYSYAFPVPSDFLRLHPSHTDESDWAIERVSGVGTCILTNDGDTLKVRYIARVSDAGVFDPLFVETFAARIAFELCEKITNSSQKKREAWEAYTMALADAKRVNAIEKVSAEPPEDPYITARL